MENITQNYTNATARPLTAFFVEPLGLLIARFALEVGIAMSGLVGNVLVIIVIASKRLRGRSAMHYFIMNLALADIGVLTIIFPIAVIKERLAFYWPFGEIVCLYIIPWVDTFYGASIWFITSIAFQRYMNIVRASEHLHRQGSKHLRCYLLGVWLLSFTVVSLPIFFFMKYWIKGKYNLCFVDWSNVKAFEPVYVISLVVFTYGLPMTIIFWTYIGIWREIRKSTLWHRSRTQSVGSGARMDTEHQRMKENARAKKILTPIVLTFATCMLPVNIFRLLTYFWPPVLKVYHFWTLYHVVVIITITNSAVNPLIYSIVSQDFRRAFAQLLFKVLNRDKNSVYTQVTRTNGYSNHGSHSRPKEDPKKVSMNRNSTNFSTKHWPEPKSLKESII